jgi:hypothetical protein
MEKVEGKPGGLVLVGGARAAVRVTLMTLATTLATLELTVGQ